MITQDHVARLVDELMLVSVLVAGEGAAGLAASLEAAGAAAATLGEGEAAEGYDLAIMLARPDAAAAPATRALVGALSAASERLLFAPRAADGGADARPDGVLPELPLWFELFAEFGYQPVVEFDAGFLAPGAFLVDRAAIAAEGDLAAFADRLQSPGAAARQDGAGPPPAATAPAGRPADEDAERAGSRAALDAAQAERAALAARLAEAEAQLARSAQALAQAQGEAAGWERLRHWVRAAVADPSRDTLAWLARDLARLNALRVAAGLPPVLLPPGARWRLWRRVPAVPEILALSALVRTSPLFDAAWYAASVAELADAPLDPVFHYLLVGAAQGADPGPWFDSAAYRAAHTGLAPGEAPLVHAIRTGRAGEIATG